MDKIIAIDFDGTMCKNAWPEIGEPNFAVLDALFREKQAGAKLILWTCRDGRTLEDAIDWAADQGITFDAVNDNLPEVAASMGCNSRKVVATEYWDDRSIDPSSWDNKVCVSFTNVRYGGTHFVSYYNRPMIWENLLPILEPVERQRVYDLILSAIQQRISREGKLVGDTFIYEGSGLRIEFA